jgi:hypothetical protein
MKTSPCVRSGLCCKIAICPYGAPNEEGGCKFLLTKIKGEDFEFFECGQHDYIITQPGHEFMPAFGEGCCMALANQFRQANIKALVDRKVNPRDIIPAKYFKQ